MQVKHFFLLLAGLLTACGAADTDATPPTSETTMQLPSLDSIDYTIDPLGSVGPIDPNTDLATLQRVFGAARVQSTDIELGEGEQAPGFTVLPGTPDEVTVYLGKAGAKTTRFAQIDTPDGAWQTQEGLRIGTTLAQLRQINGAPVTILGFGWDYAGTVISWNSGLYQDKPMIVRLAVPDGMELPEAYLGDQSLPEDLPDEIASQLYVSTIIVYLE